jgi:hypothetical protein
MGMPRILAILLALVAGLAASAGAQPQPAGAVSGGKLLYRDFTVDVSAVQNDRGFAAITAAVEHQLDIVADCGAKPEVLSFFRSQPIAVSPNAHHHFSRGTGVEVNPSQLPPQQPVILHELLHAYQAYVLPGGPRNPDILKFYSQAKNGELYPARAYVLVNQLEFFAVTGSLYLWGHVDRPPGNRETLRARQPEYYAWLGELFGVQK